MFMFLHNLLVQVGLANGNRHGKSECSKRAKVLGEGLGDFQAWEIDPVYGNFHRTP